MSLYLSLNTELWLEFQLGFELNVIKNKVFFCSNREYIYPSKRATSARAMAANPKSRKSLMLPVWWISTLAGTYNPRLLPVHQSPSVKLQHVTHPPQKRSRTVYLLFLGVWWRCDGGCQWLIEVLGETWGQGHLILIPSVSERPVRNLELFLRIVRLFWKKKKNSLREWLFFF